VSLGGFIAITSVVIGRSTGELFRNTYKVQLEQAVKTLDREGPAGLSSFLADLNTAVGAEHHLVDSSGRDVASSEDRSELLRAVRSAGDRPVPVAGRLVYGQDSRDGRYWLIAVREPPFSMWSFAPFYLLLLAAVFVISWFVAVGIASPLRTLAATADRFGRGDLDARVRYRGRNEIGRLAASFNEMAARIQTLLTGQRRLLQDVSHELRSPLARLNFAAELARTAPDRQAAVDRLQREIDRLGSLVDELIGITRAEGDAAERPMRRVDLDAVVAEVLEACSYDAQARPCRIVVRGSAPHGVMGDTELLRRAVENVLRNAVQHAPQGSEVQLEIDQHAVETVIRIRDSGPGVPDALLGKIFEPFFRVDEVRQAGTGGVGLGLSITSRAMQLHNGTVRAENADPGLRVVMTLPTFSRSAQPAA
jgi:two-component system sensor histidine kinase CpxA